jgi:predicted nucleic acid-binding protein
LNRFVLDASVALRWFLDASIPPYANQVKRMLVNGDVALVPALWHLEVANALVIAERLRMLKPDDVDQALRGIEQLLIQAIETDTGLVSARQCAASARSFNLSSYDATYLNLATRESLPLATLDGPLRHAAKLARVEIV